MRSGASPISLFLCTCQLFASKKLSRKPRTTCTSCKFSSLLPDRERCLFFSFSFFPRPQDLRTKVCEQNPPTPRQQAFSGQPPETNKQTKWEKKQTKTLLNAFVFTHRGRAGVERKKEGEKREKKKTTTDYITVEVAWPGSNKELILTSAVCGACQSRAAAI